MRLNKSDNTISLRRVSKQISFTRVGRRGPKGEDGDKHFAMAFVNSALLEVEHNLGKFPAVTVIDSANDEVIGDVEYVDSNNIIVRFSSSFSGNIFCN